MYEERPLYLSAERGITVSSFASFCRGLVGSTIQDFCVREDGTGVYLRAGDRSVDLVYKPNSPNMVKFREPALTIFPYGRESQIHEYLTPEMLLDTNVAAEKPEVLRDILTMLYIGQECRQAFLEPRRALAINFRTPTIPEDTPFFNPSTVPLRTDQDDVFLFMEEANFLMAFCEETGKGAVYKPTEADR